MTLPQEISSYTPNHLPHLPRPTHPPACSPGNREDSVLSDHLTPAQQRVLALLSAGSTANAAAQAVGVHRNTVGNWGRSSVFRDALIQARRDHDLAWRQQAASLTFQATGAIQAILADPQTPAAVRLQAALGVRGRQPAKVPVPRPGVSTGRNQLCPCGSGRKFKRCCMSNV
jgi:hypothetical protein